MGDPVLDPITAFQAKHPSSLKGAIVILAFPTHCGIDCLRGNLRTQDWNVWNMVGALDRFLLQMYPCPIVVFHEDYDDEQKEKIAKAASVPVVFPRVDFSPKNLPSYLNLSLIEPDVRASHRDGNLSLPSMPGTFHGFGYRQMCRFFANLIFWQPVMLKFDWYMRVDGGDSRITHPWRFDPFADMLRRGARYAYHRIEHAARNHRFDTALAKFRRAYPDVEMNNKLAKPFLDKHGLYNSRYYYNNFEVVYLPAFRTPVQSNLFEMVDREYAFFLGDTHRNGLGDADFRSLAIAFLLKPKEVHQYAKLPYRHPVAWNAGYER